MISNLRNDNQSGANEMISKALEIIENQLHSISNKTEDIKDLIVELSKHLINSRPSMAPLINTIGFLINNLEIYSKNTISSRLEQFGKNKEKREIAIESAFRTFLTDNYEKNLKIMLISYSSTINNLLIKLKEHALEIFVLESRPLFEGQRTAEILSDYFETRLIIDAAVGKFIDQVDLVLIGIDSVLRDGSIINKIGSYPLAVLAFENDVKVYAVGESLKYNLKSHYGQDIIIEGKPIKEIYNKQIPNKNLKVHNYYFDITPPKYISGIISDLGTLSTQEFLSKVIEILPINWYKTILN